MLCFPVSPIKEDLVSRRGLVSKLLICCSNTACNNETAVCDPYLPESKSSNARSILWHGKLGEGELTWNPSVLTWICFLL